MVGPVNDELPIATKCLKRVFGKLHHGDLAISVLRSSNSRSRRPPPGSVNVTTTIRIAPILDRDLGEAAQIRPQVYFDPSFEAIGTPTGPPPISRDHRLDVSLKHEISELPEPSRAGR